MPRRVLVAVIAGLVLLGGVLVALKLTSGGKHPAAASDPATVEAFADGSGGSSTAPDRQTPVGFQSTCTGAAQAAAAYGHATEQLTEQGKAPRSGLKETLDRITLGDDPAVKRIREGAMENTQPATKPVKGAGAFRVDNCAPGSTAKVSVFSCTTTPTRRAMDCYSARYELVWGGTPADWRIVAGDTTAGESTDPAWDAPYPPGGWPNPMPRAVLQERISKAGPGWRLYTNAPS